MSQDTLAKRKRVENGELRHRITIEKNAKTQNSDGSCSTTWSPLPIGDKTDGKCWAKIMPWSGSERYFAMRINANVTHRITTRYIPGLDTSMRINFEGRIFQIHYQFRMHEVREYMQILAEEGVGS